MSVTLYVECRVGIVALSFFFFSFFFRSFTAASRPSVFLFDRWSTRNEASSVFWRFGVVWDWRRGEVGADINNYNYHNQLFFLRLHAAVCPKTIALHP